MRFFFDWAFQSYIAVVLHNLAIQVEHQCTYNALVDATKVDVAFDGLRIVFESWNIVNAETVNKSSRKSFSKSKRGGEGMSEERFAK